MDTIDLFWQFVQERELIRLRREAGELRPWTEDPVLDKYRFCNVFRDLDKNTKLYLQQVEEHNAKDVVINTILYRQVTNRQAWLELGWQPADFKVERLQELWDSRKARRLPMFSGDITTPTYSGMVDGATMIERMQRCAEHWRTHASSIMYGVEDIQTAFRRLIELRGIGKFYGWQIALDLSYTFDLSRDVWCHAGPGAWAGLREIYGEDEFRIIRKDGGGKKCGFAQPDHKQAAKALPYLQSLRDNQPVLKAYRRLELADVEHVLCEYSKYRRHQRGERPGCLFIPFEGDHRGVR